MIMQPTHNEMTAALVDAYRRASGEQRERGRAWYPNAGRKVRRIARRTGTTVARTACTMAITSPDAQLVTNLAWTERACETGGAAKVGRYPNAMHGRYAPVLAGTVAPLAALRGPKIRNFYRGIMGDVYSVCIDRWALRAAGWPADTVTPRQYERVAAAYREAAALCGETPRDFQAIVWTVVREDTGIAYTDIHH